MRGTGWVRVASLRTPEAFRAHLRAGRIGLPVDDILARSDLYDREGKYPHAFSHEVGREGDTIFIASDFIFFKKK